MPSSPTVTTLLREWSSGDPIALEALTPIVYDHLRRIAHRQMRSERGDHTLQATALVNEAFVRLADADAGYADRAHFFALAARTMRRILTDHGRARASQKRGGGVQAITLIDDRMPDEQPVDVVELDDALEKLKRLDERKSDLLVLHYFGGMTHEEAAEALGVSPATVDRDLRFARAWLANELKDD